MAESGWWRDDAQPVKRRARPRYRENREQMALFHWFQAARYKGQPLTHYAWHYPSAGYRTPREASRLQAMGVRPGVPDVALLIAAHGHHGLFLELKADKTAASRKGRLTDDQKAVCQMLVEQGYFVRVAYSWHEAARHICDYLDLPEHVRPWALRGDRHGTRPPTEKLSASSHPPPDPQPQSPDPRRRTPRRARRRVGEPAAVSDR